MKKISAYQFLELSTTAKTEAESGALIYASAMLLQGVQGNNGCPPHLMQKFHDDFRQEYLKGWFSRNGKTNFPAGVVEEVDGRN